MMTNMINKVLNRCEEIELEGLAPLAKEELKTVILVGLVTGIHLLDIVYLTWKNVDLDASFIAVHELVIRDMVMVPFDEQVSTRLAAMPSFGSAQGHLFPQLIATSLATMQNQLQTLIEKSGAQDLLHEARNAFLEAV